ncbi:MAG: TIM-barrel domain-containing protein [Chloroflexota bacterium]
MAAATHGERARLAWTSPPDERFLGFADQGAGHSSAFPPDRAPLDHRGQLLQMAGMSSHRHYYVPFYLSSRGYGFFLNTLRMSWWDIARSDPARISIEVDEPRLDFYVFGATSLSEVLERYTGLVGRPPLPPKWFMGERITPKKHGIEIDGVIPEEGWNTRWFDQKEIEFAAHTARATHQPCDFMHFDSPWQTIRNSFEWVSEVPDPAGLMSVLNRLHIKVDLWERSTIAVGDYAVYREAEERGFLVKNGDGTPFVCEQKYGGPSGMVDFTNPAAIAWWQDLHAPLVADGASSFKLDSASSGFIEAYPELREARFHNGMTGKELEHYYGPLYMKTVWDGLRRQLNGRRVGLHVYHQTYFAGGRYPFVGLGDPGWQSPRATMIRYALNYGLTGIPFYQGGEYGSFGLPGGGPDLRRRTMPYTYSYWRIAHNTGLPVTRALALAYQDDPNSYAADAQFLSGREFLVAPALEQGEAWRRVYLPRGEWVDYWSKERQMGPGWQHFRARPGREPLFVRGGAIIPMAAPMEYIGERPMTELTLDVYPCGESDVTLYEDDGETYAYEDGACARTRFSCSEQETSVEVTIGSTDGDYAGMPAQRTYVLEVHGTTRPGRVTLDGVAIPAFANEARASARRRIVFGELRARRRMPPRQPGSGRPPAGAIDSEMGLTGRWS